jgi:hypothetical protein
MGHAPCAPMTHPRRRVRPSSCGRGRIQMGPRGEVKHSPRKPDLAWQRWVTPVATDARDDASLTTIGALAQQIVTAAGGPPTGAE